MFSLFLLVMPETPQTELLVDKFGSVPMKCMVWQIFLKISKWYKWRYERGCCFVKFFIVVYSHWTS